MRRTYRIGAGWGGTPAADERTTRRWSEPWVPVPPAAACAAHRREAAEARDGLGASQSCENNSQHSLRVYFSRRLDILPSPRWPKCGGNQGRETPCRQNYIVRPPRPTNTPQNRTERPLSITAKAIRRRGRSMALQRTLIRKPRISIRRQRTPRAVRSKCLGGAISPPNFSHPHEAAGRGA